MSEIKERIAKRIHLRYGFVDWDVETPSGEKRALDTSGEIHDIYKARFATELNKLKVLEDSELNRALDNAFDVPINFDHKPTAEEIITIRLRAMAQAQLSRTIKDIKDLLK